MMSELHISAFVLTCNERNMCEIGIKDAEIFYETGYDIEADYKANLKADVENSGFGLMLYDNVYKESLSFRSLDNSWRRL